MTTSPRHRRYRRISRNTVKRESFEELGNLGIYDFPIDVDKMKPLDMSEVRDDNYAINIWNGYGQVWAVTPYCYRLEVPESMLDRLHEASLCQKHEKNSEARSYLKMTLFDALPRYGKRSGEVLSADGRDMTYDYRYPHEWLVSWKIAAEALNGEPKDLLLLAAEVQKTSEHRSALPPRPKTWDKIWILLPKRLSFRRIRFAKWKETFRPCIGKNSALLHNRKNKPCRIEKKIYSSPEERLS